jgi:hypothetical protein
MGDVTGLVNALHAIEHAVTNERKPGVVQIDRHTQLDCIPALRPN